MNKIIIFLFLLSVFIFNFLPVKDTDFGWHYRCGKEFWNNKSICLKNNFSYFLPNYQSAYPSLLYDIPLAFIYDRFGFIGLSFIGGIVITLAAFFYLKLLENSLFFKIISFYLILILSSLVFNLGLRSQLITYLFFLITLFIIEKAHKNLRFLFFFPLLLIVWVNSHIGFFLGPLILIFSQIKKQKNYLISLLIIGLSLLATLINPFGIKVYGEIYNHLLSPLNQMIAEWVEPPPVEIVLILILSVSAAVLLIKKKIFSWFDWILLVFFSILALKGRRNLPFFYTIFFYLLAKNLKLNLEQLEVVSIPLLIAVILFLLITKIPTTLQFDASWNKYCYQGLWVYPCRAIEKYPQLSGNVFNEYEWGGFLIWQKPEIKVFVDGRMPAWRDENGQSPYQIFLDILQTKPGWNEKLTRLHTDYILIAKGVFLDLLLQPNPQSYGWQEEYRDKVAAIYKKL